MSSREASGVGAGVAISGDCAGVAIAREAEEDEVFSGDRVGEGKLVSEVGTEGSGPAAGVTSEQASIPAAANAKIDDEKRVFTS